MIVMLQDNDIIHALLSCNYFLYDGHVIMILLYENLVCNNIGQRDSSCQILLSFGNILLGDSSCQILLSFRNDLIKE
jgi:hypothetical protein